MFHVPSCNIEFLSISKLWTPSTYGMPLSWLLHWNELPHPPFTVLHAMSCCVLFLTSSLSQHGVSEKRKMFSKKYRPCRNEPGSSSGTSNFIALRYQSLFALKCRWRNIRIWLADSDDIVSAVSYEGKAPPRRSSEYNAKYPQWPVPGVDTRSYVTATSENNKAEESQDRQRQELICFSSVRAFRFSVLHY